MELHVRHQTLFGFMFTCILVLFVTACGNDDPPATNTQAPNEIVLADAGKIIGVRLNEVVTLDGRGSSTALKEPLSFTWSFTHKPYGSTAVLQNKKSSVASFIADVEGTYMVQLVVRAGGYTSQRAIASVEATTAGHYTGRRVHLRYSSQCADCHDGRLSINNGPVDPSLTKPGNHFAASNMCEACHTTFGFNLLRYVDHLEVTGKCSDCHNGVVAIDKSQFHVATSAECSDCHTTTSFLTLAPDGTFDHSSVTSTCTRCHNGITALGKHQTHPVTDADCQSCHNTASFKGAYPDHNGPDFIGKRCDSCHNETGGGHGARDQTAGHPFMAVDCGICHDTTSFNMGGIFYHRLIDSATQACSVCHNDNNSIGARGKGAAVPEHLPTNSDCGICHGVGGGSFASGIYDHTNITTNCGSAGCHDPVSPEGIYAAGAHHVASNGNDCENCHTPGNFATGIYDHTLVEADLNIRCDSCHNDVITAGMDLNHIPTTDDCRSCHTNTTSFIGAVFIHTGITNGCAACHDGNISIGKSLNHMPTTRDCSDCHIVKFDNFTGGDFDHLGVTNNCATCHDGVIAMGKKLNHIPARNECSQCHIDTNVNGFVSSTFITNVHPGLSSGCEGCHKSKFLFARPDLLKAANHVPTTQDCRFCHTNTSFTPQIFNHSDISGNCASCHNGNYVTPAGALGKTPTPPHPATTTDCGICHGIGATFANGIFDHTGRVDNCAVCHGDGASGAVSKKHLAHVPTSEDCSVCHVPGSFKTAVFSHQGILNNCASCHDGAVATATTKSTNHLPTTQDCSDCHNTTAFAGARFDHQGIVNNCALCHNGDTAIGKHGNHIPTNDDCGKCHQTTGFKPATFDHIGITNNCQFCHNGTLARGKEGGHVLTSQDCGLCHNTRGFIPATFDHSVLTIATRCDSCHVDGSPNATGKDDKINPVHLPTALDCRDCHTTATFAGGTWLHDESTAGICKTCHITNGGATPQPLPTQGHINTDLQCDTCHSTSGWAPTSFSHSPVGNYPGDHNGAPGCGACHGNIITTPFEYPSPLYAPFCAGCHANDFDRVGKHNGGENGTVEQNKDCSGGGRGCHKVTDNAFD